MYKPYKSILILLLLILNISIYAQPDNKTLPDSKVSLWKGFKRIDFKFNNRDARLVIPDKNLPGSPWIWRARFPDWHTEADSILISRGFHLAYIDTDHLFGSPRAINIWNKFYHFLTVKFELNEKVSLMGVSRGGLFIYNWAKKNPEKINCIYAEAPVCDFKSWPAGFGRSEGSPDDWERLKEVYGFKNNEEARKYFNNPIDNLETLAKHKIPVLHMISLRDSIVPAEENTFNLINKYIRLGGIATVIPCTKEKQTLQGHHFPIESPKIVADFIMYYSSQKTFLSSSEYHLVRYGLKNSLIRFEKEKKGRVAFLGGSITYNSGWRDSVCAYLMNRFPETGFEFIVAGIPSMGSTPGAFRLKRDVLSKGKVDLLFVESAVNDAVNERSSTEQIRAMEGIIRHSQKSNPEMDIVLMHFVDQEKISCYNKGMEPDVITNHNIIAEHYNIPTINLAKEVTDRINNGEFTWGDDFKNLHPSPFGQGVYANSIITFLSNEFSSSIDADDKIFSHKMPGKYDYYCYGNGELIEAINAKISGGWEIDSSWNANDGIDTRNNYVNVPFLIGNSNSGILKYRFTGNTIGIAVVAGPDAATIRYRIDKKEWKTLNLHTKWSKHIYLPWYYTLSSELPGSKHLLEIKIVKNKDASKKKNVCRIRYFYTNIVN